MSKILYTHYATRVSILSYKDQKDGVAGDDIQTSRAISVEYQALLTFDCDQPVENRRFCEQERPPCFVAILSMF